MPVNKMLVEQLQAELLEETTKLLLEKVRAKKATPQELQAAIRLLADNNVTIEIKEGAPMSELSRAFDPMEDGGEGGHVLPFVLPPLERKVQHA